MYLSSKLTSLPFGWTDLLPIKLCLITFMEISRIDVYFYNKVFGKSVRVQKITIHLRGFIDTYCFCNLIITSLAIVILF